MSARAAELFLVVDYLSEVHQDWLESPVEFLTTEFEDALEECFAAFEAGSIPEECREVADRLQRLKEEWDKFAEYVSAKNPTPRDAFWGAFEALISARKSTDQEQPITLEPVAVLDKQKVSHRQIAQMYGWVRGGVPDESKVREELAKPGTHVTPDFVPPRERERREKLAKSARYREQLIEQRSQKQQKRGGNAPESIEELIGQGVSVRQICLMKDCEAPEVIAAAHAMGKEPPIDQDPRNFRAPHEQQITEEQDRALQPKLHSPAEDVELADDGEDAIEDADAEAAADDEPADELDEQIRQRAGQGYTHKQIAELLKIPQKRIKRALAEQPAS